jgi:acyl-CoA thioesterase FadM
MRSVTVRVRHQRHVYVATFIYTQHYGLFFFMHAASLLNASPCHGLPTFCPHAFLSSSFIASLQVDVLIRDPSTMPETVRVSSWVSKIGRTSWQSCTQITGRRLGGVGELVIARSVTTMVCLDARLEKTVPVPCAEELRALVRPPPNVGGVDVMSSSPPPTNAFKWTSIVRQTDCDSFGHVTNTKYPVMAEEAR